MDLGGCGNSEPFALQVIDDSMEPEFKRGCIIIIDPSGVVEHHCYVLAMVENGYIFRQLCIESGGYYLQPLNEDYLHEKRAITQDAIKGVIVQQAGSTGKRADRKNYVSFHKPN
ncbi:MAG: S24 family peptidase [Gammaproteobacteria bacterium]|nr:S24 family peptidase [Gammaproteobacteria bacterium]